MRTTPIGITMLNDGREHVWSVNQAENMAVVDKWVSVLRKELMNADGTSPEIVAASKTITGVRAAQEVGEELVRKGCKQIIMCYNVWNFPYMVWPFLNSFGRDVPVLSLSNNNGKFPGNVGLLATDGDIRQTGKRTHRIVGDINNPNTIKNVVDWIRASNALTTIKNEVYGLYGGPSMGMGTGIFHQIPTIKALGCAMYQIDQYQLIKDAEAIPESEVEPGIKWFEKLLGDRLLYDNDMLTKETLGRQIRIYLAMKKRNEMEGFDFCGLKGQRELTENYTLGDIPEMMLNDPYDWNGAKEPTVCATEADSNGALTMQLLKYISGGFPTLFMDVRLYIPELDIWDWCNSGNHSSWYASQSFDPAENYKKITFHPALKYYFKAGGASVAFDAAAGEMTFARLGYWDEKPYMFITKGKSLELPAEKREEINNSTDPTWPHVHAKLDCSFDEFVNLFPANHAQGVIGNRVRALKYLCEISGITPIIGGEEAKKFIAPVWERVK